MLNIRITWQFFHVIAALFVDQVTDYTRTNTNVVEAAAQKLLTEIVALMQSIGRLFDLVKSSMIELLYSRGIGGWIKTTIEVICTIVELIYNTLWAYLLCPVVQFVLQLVTIFVNFIQKLVRVLDAIPFVPVEWAYDKWRRRRSGPTQQSSSPPMPTPVTFCNSGAERGASLDSQILK